MIIYIYENIKIKYNVFVWLPLSQPRGLIPELSGVGMTRAEEKNYKVTNGQHCSNFMRSKRLLSTLLIPHNFFPLGEETQV